MICQRGKVYLLMSHSKRLWWQKLQEKCGHSKRDLCEFPVWCLCDKLRRKLERRSKILFGIHKLFENSFETQLWEKQTSQKHLGPVRFPSKRGNGTKENVCIKINRKRNLFNIKWPSSCNCLSQFHIANKGHVHGTIDWVDHSVPSNGTHRSRSIPSVYVTINLNTLARWEGHSLLYSFRFQSHAFFKFRKLPRNIHTVHTRSTKITGSFASWMRMRMRATERCIFIPLLL